MITRTVYCHYKRKDPLVEKLGDLKIQYADTQSQLIKSLLRQTEELIFYRVGTIEDLRKRVNGIFMHCRTQEEYCFIDKLKKLIK